jgi:hypothetical protein
MAMRADLLATDSRYDIWRAGYRKSCLENGGIVAHFNFAAITYAMAAIRAVQRMSRKRRH